MRKIIDYIRAWLWQRKMQDVQRFAHSHRNFLVIVVDPKDDTMFMSYRDKQIASKIKDASGQQAHIMKKVMRHSTFKSEGDRFLGAIIDALQCPVNIANSFYQWVDASLFNITKSLKIKNAADKAVDGIYQNMTTTKEKV